jgi:hypothetical protein
MSFGVIILFGLMALTVLILLFGMFSMARGGEFNKKHGNKLMTLRVMCQGAAIAMFALLVMLGSRHA